ncbi:hypothetical protein VPH35_119318 [Triticum aestivum]
MPEADVTTNTLAISPGHDVVGDSPQPRQQEINIDHRPHMSVDELLKIIKGANGMPVLFIPSSDGQLAAIAVDGLHNIVPVSGVEKKQEDFRSWVLLLTSLAATITFTAGLAPPGGFWAADDESNKVVAGTSVMHDKFPIRFAIFHFSNTTAFLSSLMIIGMLAKNIYHKEPITMKNNALFLFCAGCSIQCVEVRESPECILQVGDTKGTEIRNNMGNMASRRSMVKDAGERINHKIEKWGRNRIPLP